MNTKTKSVIAAALTTALPVIAFAQTNMKLQGLVDIILDLLNKALVLLMALAIVFFVWYVIQYFIKPNEDRKNANSYIMWSIIGFFVILSVWGIVNILVNTFQLGNSTTQSQSWGNFKNIFPH